MFKVGRVIHYYDKIAVAIVELDNTLSVGEKVRFVRGGEDLFDQVIESIQIEHQKVESAKRGQVVGISTTQIVREGAEVFKL